MYRVYWSEVDLDPAIGWFVIPKSEDHADLIDALACVAKHRELEHTFVTMVAGNVPGMVGKMGVTPAPADYAWTKRRSTALRKDVNLTDEKEVPLEEE